MINKKDHIHDQIMSVVIHAENILRREGVKFQTLFDLADTPTICDFMIRDFSKIEDLFEYMYHLSQHPIVENISTTKSSIVISFLHGEKLLKYIRKEKLKKFL